MISESLPSFLLVDGNNIIHAWPELLKQHQKHPGRAHRELIQALSDYGLAFLILNRWVNKQ